MTQQTAPIWLKMKPNYIDENFENVVSYMNMNNMLSVSLPPS